LIPALAGSRQSIGTSVTRQVFAGLPKIQGQFIAIGTVKKAGNL
jgi:hypothetical protein